MALLERLRARARNVHARYANPDISLEDMLLFVGFVADERESAVNALHAVSTSRRKLLRMHNERKFKDRLEDVLSCLRHAIDDAQYYARMRDGFQVGTSMFGIAGGAMTLAASVSPPLAVAGAVVSVASGLTGLFASVGTKGVIDSNVEAAQKAWESFTAMGLAIREAVQVHEYATRTWLALTDEQADLVEHILRIYTATAMDLEADRVTEADGVTEADEVTEPEPMDIYMRMLARFQIDQTAPPIKIMKPCQMDMHTVVSDDRAAIMVRTGKTVSTISGGVNGFRLLASQEISKARQLAALAKEGMATYLQDIQQLTVQIGNIPAVPKSFGTCKFENGAFQISIPEINSDQLGQIPTIQQLANQDMMKHAQAKARQFRAKIQAAEQSQKTAAANSLGWFGTGLVVVSMVIDVCMVCQGVFSYQAGSPYPAQQALKVWHKDMEKSEGAFDMVDDLCQRFDAAVQSYRAPLPAIMNGQPQAS